ncbi:SRPBCC domain-containing protein [Crocinitomix catalasitica]|nr:SRPBCC domain-containing protein [Crocinitomix catalasitica]
MNKDLKVLASVDIIAEVDKVWDALVNPEKIKVYLFGTETITDWQVGSAIIFQGVYEGDEYKDKGKVLENRPNEFLKYAYWSQFSGLEDKEENYSHISLLLEATAENQVKLTWSQQGFSNEKMKEHSESGLPALLDSIKTLVEDG